jgi:hypothetical protein
MLYPRIQVSAEGVRHHSDSIDGKEGFWASSGCRSFKVSHPALPIVYNTLTLSRDSFIYEYVGDVVSHPSFMKRMRQYGEEGVKHFYFMMLQKDEVCFPTIRFLH